MGRREINHVHGESLVDVPLPRGFRDAFIALAVPKHRASWPESSKRDEEGRAVAPLGLGSGLVTREDRKGVDTSRCLRSGNSLVDVEVRPDQPVVFLHHAAVHHDLQSGLLGHRCRLGVVDPFLHPDRFRPDGDSLLDERLDFR